MSKRGQVTLFIILGIVFVIGLTLVFYMQQPDEYVQDQEDSQDLVFSYVQSCLRNQIVDGFDQFGFDQTALNSYVETTLPVCVQGGVAALEEEGFDIEVGSPSVSLEITDTTLKTDVTYPMKLGGEDYVVETSDFYSVLDRVVYAELEHTSDCVTTKDTGLLSFDEKVSIFIPEGTMAKKGDGSCLNEISLTLDSPKSEVVTLGDIAYEAGPTGAFFYPYADYRVRFTHADLTEFLDNGGNDLRLAYYDPVDKTHYAYPTELPNLYNRVDWEKREIQARITHFTLTLTAENCNQDYAGDVFYSTVISESCDRTKGNQAAPCKTDEKEVSFSVSIPEDDSCHDKLEGIMFIGVEPADKVLTCWSPEMGGFMETSAGTHSVKCDVEVEKDPTTFTAYFAMRGVGGDVSGGTAIDPMTETIGGQSVFDLAYGYAQAAGIEVCYGTGNGNGNGEGNSEGNGNGGGCAAAGSKEACMDELYEVKYDAPYSSQEELDGRRKSFTSSSYWVNNCAAATGIGPGETYNWASGGEGNGASGGAAPGITPGNSGSECGGGSKFLWKPISEKYEKLVILHGDGSNPRIYDDEGNFVASGEDGSCSNGYDHTVRFGSPGGSYPSPAIVDLGSRQCYIADTSQRVESCVTPPTIIDDGGLDTSGTSCGSVVSGSCDGFFYCDDGELIPSCHDRCAGQCGDPDDFVCIQQPSSEDYGFCVAKCGSILAGTCASGQPYICNDKSELEENCIECGNCPSGTTCVDNPGAPAYGTCV